MEEQKVKMLVDPCMGRPLKVKKMYPIGKKIELDLRTDLL